MRRPSPEQITECLSALREYQSLEGEEASAALARAAAAVKVVPRPVVWESPVARLPEPPHFVDFATAERMLGICRQTLVRWRAGGKITAVGNRQRSTLIPLADVRRILDGRTQ